VSKKEQFDRAEAVLGALVQDMVNVRAVASPEHRAYTRSHCFGRSPRRSTHGHGNPAADLVHEFESQGKQWGPLKAGLFGGDEERARTALDKYQVDFNNLAGRRMFYVESIGCTAVEYSNKPDRTEL
jgi:hypothetical protein